eukprot:35410-Alexandrium_andersonii.AAC.1
MPGMLFTKRRLKSPSQGAQPSLDSLVGVPWLAGDIAQVVLGPARPSDGARNCGEQSGEAAGRTSAF